MNKEDLKTSLDVIRPPEELIQATICKLEERKRQKSGTLFSWNNPHIYRYAAVLCTIVLLCGVSIASMGNGSLFLQNMHLFPDNANSRNIPGTESAQDPAQVPAPISLLSHEEQNADVPLSGNTIQGTLQACYLDTLTEADRQNGMIARGTMELAPTADGETIRAVICFYDRDRLNTFLGAISHQLTVTLAPTDRYPDATLEVLDFSVEAEK